jgi:hypothetical protein
MAADVTIVIPVWDQHTQLLPRCLNAIRNEQVAAEIIIVDNASDVPVDVRCTERWICLRQHPIRRVRRRRRRGGAWLAGSRRGATPPRPPHRGRHRAQHRRRARPVPQTRTHPPHGVPSRSQYLPSLAPLFWLAAFQCSITSTVLRAASVRDAGGFPDTDIAENWQLATRLARRGPLICLNEPVRIHHRHPNAARNTTAHQDATTLRATIRADCTTDPVASLVQRLVASALRTYSLARRTT